MWMYCVGVLCGCIVWVYCVYAFRKFTVWVFCLGVLRKCIVWVGGWVCIVCMYCVSVLCGCTVWVYFVCVYLESLFRSIRHLLFFVNRGVASPGACMNY